MLQFFFQGTLYTSMLHKGTELPWNWQTFNCLLFMDNRSLFRFYRWFNLCIWFLFCILYFINENVIIDWFYFCIEAQNFLEMMKYSIFCCLCRILYWFNFIIGLTCTYHDLYFMNSNKNIGWFYFCMKSWSFLGIVNLSIVFHLCSILYSFNFTIGRTCICYMLYFTNWNIDRYYFVVDYLFVFNKFFYLSFLNWNHRRLVANCSCPSILTNATMQG